MKTGLPEVTIARLEDEDRLMEMCNQLHRENGLFSLNSSKLKVLMRKCYARSDKVATPVIVGVIRNAGTIEASTCLMVSDFYYSDDWHLAELWNYVDPAFRKSHNAEALIEFGKACADKMRIPLITGIITNRQMAGKVRLYRRSFGYPTGAFFVYGAKWVPEPIQDHTVLQQRLKEFAQLCNDRRLSPTDAQKKLAPLLREAAEAIGGEDNIWGSATGKSAGAQVRGAA